MLKIMEAILRTGALTDEQIRKEAPELEDEEIQLILKIRAVLDGEKAVVMLNPSETEYWFCGLTDNGKCKEAVYLMEQQPMVGCYIGQREEFDRDFDNGDYSMDFHFCLKKSEVEIIKDLKVPMPGDTDA